MKNNTIDPRIRAIYYIMFDIKLIRMMMKDWEAYDIYSNLKHNNIYPKNYIDYVLKEIHYYKKMGMNNNNFEITLIGENKLSVNNL